MIKGVRASLSISEKVGGTMKNVRKSGSGMRRWFGGIDCVARDVGRKDRRMRRLVKEVMKMKIGGGMENSVKRRKRGRLGVRSGGWVELNK